MNFCAQCGHELGIGRFCTNCGHPVGEPAAAESAGEQTAVRSAPAHATQPSAPPVVPPGTPSEARFPLFADEVDPDAPPITAEQPILPAAYAAEPAAGRTHRRRSVAPWLMGVAILILIALIGGALLLGGNDRPTTGASGPGSSVKPPGSAQSGNGDGTSPPPGQRGELARYLSVTAPPPAPPNQDVNGNLVRYVADNMLDGAPDTCWRTPGDATGATLTFSLPQPAEITRVGLVNGYAKVATDSSGTYDWYRGNRRVLVAEWTFDDGTTVRQRLHQTTDMQTVDVDHVRTRAISLRLLEVSPPGRGRSSRNYTAISEVSVTGATSG